MLHNTKLERLGKYKPSSLSGLFISYEENEVLWIQPQGLYSQHFIFFVTYESAQEVRLFHNYKLERLTSDKHFN